MTQYTIQAVGEPMGPKREIEAFSAHYAVAEAAGCGLSAVCLPIWRKERPYWWRRPQSERYEVECYMPRDDSGRQWLVSEAA